MIWLSASSQEAFRLPPYRQYTLRDGLSQMQVTDIMQDSRGYIWIGTKGGLNRFDGEHFYKYSTSAFPAIVNDNIHNIREDIRGRIWASTNAGLFYTEGTDPVYFDEIKLSRAVLAADTKGNVWFFSYVQATQQLHFGYSDGEKLVWFDHLLPEVKQPGYFDIAIDQTEDIVLLSIDSCLYRFTGSGTELLFKKNSPFQFSKSSGNNIYFPGYNADETLTLYQYASGEINEVAQIKDNSYLYPPLLKDTVIFLRLIPPYFNQCLTPESVLSGLNQGIQTNFVLIDKEKTVWLGSEHGLYQLFDNGLTAYSEEFLPQIWAVTEDHNNDLWFTSYLYGIFRLKNGQRTHFAKDPMTNLYSPYFHPAVDKRGRIFIANNHGMLMVDGDRFELKKELPFLTCFYDAERDLIWGGGRSKATAFDQHRKEVLKIDETSGLDVGNNVLTIKKDHSGFYWFGGGRGVARYDWDSGMLKHYRPGGRINGVPTSCVDHTGRIWFGSKQGLYWYDAASDSLLQLDREELSDAVNLVTTIDSTWLIASQPQGIYLIDLQEYYKTGNISLYLFNEKNGFAGIEPGQDGAFTDSRGIVWLTTSTVLVSLDPKKLKTGRNDLTVRIEKINGQRVPFTTGRIDLPPNQNAMVASFSTICFNRPNPVEFSWKLENGNWSDWQEENYAVLSGLKDGHNTLSVRARIRGLPLDSPAQADFPVHIRLAVYRQAWFWPAIFLLLSLAGLVSLVIVLMRMKKISREATIFQMQAIQSQMNPHFIFNVLAFLQSRILKNSMEQANTLLVRMADLIRGFLEASVVSGKMIHPDQPEGQITLSQELNLTGEFIHLQSSIFPDKFDYQLNVTGVDCEKEYIPPMLIQPFVENAIRHGLLPLKTKGELKVDIRKSGNSLYVEISDNGKGIRQADELITHSSFRYVSRGRELTIRRIELLNKMGFRISLKTESNESGTKVTLKIR
jgi:streptogramin lyase